MQITTNFKDFITTLITRLLAIFQHVTWIFIAFAITCPGITMLIIVFACCTYQNDSCNNCLSRFLIFGPGNNKIISFEPNKNLASKLLETKKKIKNFNFFLYGALNKRKKPLKKRLSRGDYEFIFLKNP